MRMSFPRAIAMAAAMVVLSLAPCASAQSCTPVEHCVSQSCVDGAAACDVCESGFFRTAEGTCQPCTDVDQCVAPLVCTNPLNSFCAQCQSGSYVVDTPAGGTVCAD